MSDRVEVLITAKDNLSPVLAKAGASGTKMGDQLSRSSKTASAGLRDLGTSAKATDADLGRLEAEASKTGSSLDKAKAGATAFGAALGLLTSVAAKAGQASVQQAQQIRALDKAYGDGSQSMQDFAKHIQETTTFSDEQARQAEITASTLARNYGLTTEQIQGLITASADLAAVTGINLDDAVQRTSAAIRGEAESAEALGLTMNQAAIDHEGLTLTMSNQEAAAFRLKALMEQSAFATGAAGEAAATTSGKVRQIENAFQDAATGVGGFLGPVGQVAAELAPVAIALPVIGAGLGKIATPAAAAGKGLVAMAASSGGVGALGTAVTGLGAAAIVAAPAVIAVALAMHQAGEAAATSDAQTAEVDARVAQMGEAFQTTGDQILDFIRTYRGVDVGTVVGGQAVFLADAFEKSINLTDEQTASLSHLIDTANPTAEQVSAVTAAIFTFSEANANAAQTSLETARGMVQIATAASTASAAIALHNTQLGSANQTALETARSSVAIESGIASRAKAWNEEQAKIKVDQQAMLDLGNTMSTVARQTALETARSSVTISGSYRLQALAAMENAGAMEEAATAQRERQREAQRLAVELTNTYRDQLGVQTTMLQSIVALERASSGGGTKFNVDTSGVAELALGLTNAAVQMDLSVGVIVGGLDAIGQRSEGLAKTATDLVGAFGEWAQIDDLLAAGAVSMGTYNSAVAAGYAIQNDNVAVQQALGGVMAQQLPYLAQQEAAYAAQVAQLGELTPAQQRLALAYMDTGEQAKIQSAFALAASANMGELGANGKRAAEQMIASSTAADPFLKATLLDMGLINEGADGTISIDYGQASQAHSEITILTESIDALITTLGGIPPAHVGMDDQEFHAKNAGVLSALAVTSGTTAVPTIDGNPAPFDGKNAAVLGNLAITSGVVAVPTFDGNPAPFDGVNSGVLGSLAVTSGITATPGIDAIDNASGTIASVSGQLYDMDGRTATTYIDTVYRTSYVAAGGRSGYTPGYQHGGVVSDDDGIARIPAAQHGRMVMVGEAGRELVKLPGGSQVIPHTASEAMLSRGGGDAGGMVFNNYGSVQFVVPNANVARAIQQQLTGMGRV
jgi:hypothetical protein